MISHDSDAYFQAELDRLEQWLERLESAHQRRDSYIGQLEQRITDLSKMLRAQGQLIELFAAREDALMRYMDEVSLTQRQLAQAEIATLCERVDELERLLTRALDQLADHMHGKNGLPVRNQFRPRAAKLKNLLDRFPWLR